ncbi:tetratricopeptide repeat protein [Xanthobacter agilis]|jgi:hypothetical protein|uniref:Alpha/beta hydrolase n=1 Tax=Xanthobacter agilis TaxID=47492 RepID=A0ABU0LBX8_XANAG|nr:hypothetical protein [Xanthobacter agilis]MDQ0504613.1 hypothetical protein [Xanthobacter agilis]
MLLFDGSDIQVKYRAANTTADTLFITFTGRTMGRAGQQGFGEHFFAKEGVSALHFISRQSHWWQTPEMPAALAAADAVRSSFSRVITYGSSMGGHGALLFSARLEATRVLAFVPQFAINGRGAPWHRLWQADTKNLKELYRMEEGLSQTADLLVAYDPLHPIDAKHADRIKALGPVKLLKFPFSGHATASALADVGLLPELVLSLSEGSGHVQDIVNRYRKNKSHSFIVWREVTKLARIKNREKLYVAAKNKCEDVAFSRLREGSLREVESVFEFISGKYTRSPSLFTREVFEQLASRHAESALFPYLTSKWLADLGRLDSAKVDAGCALRVAPRNPTIALHLAQLLYRTGAPGEGEQLLRRTVSHPKMKGRAALLRERQALVTAGVPRDLLAELAVPPKAPVTPPVARPPRPDVRANKPVASLPA